MASLRAVMTLMTGGYHFGINRVIRYTDLATSCIIRASDAVDNFNRRLNDTGGSACRASDAVDNFNRRLDATSASANRASSAVNNYNGRLDATSRSACRVSDAVNNYNGRLDATSRSAVWVSAATNNYNRRLNDTSGSAGRASGATDNFNRRLDATGASATRASGGLGKFISLAAAIAGAVKGMKIADEYTNTAARLKLINDGLQTQEELQNKIFEAANRSRGSYNEMANAVAKMGLLAKDAFSSNDELIAFTELVQKAFRISGADPAEQAGAIRQLTQAMASGRLQGDELVSIMENAPMLYDAIAKYMGLSKEELKKLSSEGVITADIIKNAMFDAAEDINKAFEDLPMTFGDAWIAIQNNLLETFQPLIQTIAKGAQFIADNWSNIEPIFYGAAAAVGFFTVAMWIATGAAEAFFTTLLSNPIAWIALAIGVVIALIYKWVQSVGGLKIAWLIVVDAILTAWDLLKIGFFFGVYAVMDLFNKLQICFKKVSVNIANFMGDMKANVLMLLQSLVNGAIDIINDFINILNKIPGVSIDTISHVTFGTNAQLENEAAKQARNEELEKYIADKEASMAERDQKLIQMIFDAEAAHAERQLEIANAQAEAKAEKAADLTLPEFTPFDPGTIEGTGNNGKLKVEMSDEDLKYLRDIAEREYVNKFSTATLAPNIQISFGDVHETADADKIAGRIRKILQEEIAMAAEGVYD